MKIARKRLFYIFVIGALVWVLFSMVVFSGMSNKLEHVATIALGHLLGQRFDEAQLVRLLGRDTFNTSNVIYPLKQLVLSDFKVLSYFHLPLRKHSASFTELTTAYRDTSYPLAPDFTFHIQYQGREGREVTIFEDYGPGCVFRIFLFPWLTTNAEELHRLTPADLQTHMLTLSIDGQVSQFTLKHVMEGKEWPFQAPVNTQHPRPASGVGSYTPFCYQHNIRITYMSPETLPPNLFEQTINCSSQDLLCPVHIYSSVSRHKYPYGTVVPAFDLDKMKEWSSTTLQRLQQPQEYGPDAWQGCSLDCIEMCAECSRTIYTRHYAGVIVGMKLRVFETSSGTLLVDWSQLLLSIHFDDAIEPQVNRIPLGTLFGAAGSLNDFKGSIIGRRKRYCSYTDSFLDLPHQAYTGYIYFPMPFWHNARITIDGASSISTSLLLCAEITVMQNIYNEANAGYFHGAKTYFNHNVDGWRNVLTVKESWGHVVGLYMDVDNLRPNKDAINTNARWAALQSDPLLFVDGRKAASMLGTGLEDYFSYAHGFAFAENTTYSFVGNYHSSSRRKQPLSWYCYRFHILDPIPFHSSIQFIMEGTANDFTNQVKPITYQKHEKLKREATEATFANTVLYYSRPTGALSLTDEIHMGDTDSEHEHNLLVAPNNAEPFVVKGASYLGASNLNRTYNVTGRDFSAKHTFTFQLKIRQPNSGVILRRDFHAWRKSWNFKARVRVNEFGPWIWFIPMGTLSNKYSLMQDELQIGAKFTAVSMLVIQVEPQSEWRDITYQAFIIH